MHRRQALSLAAAHFVLGITWTVGTTLLARSGTADMDALHGTAGHGPFRPRRGENESQCLINRFIVEMLSLVI
jgi:hypothetical protein